MVHIERTSITLVRRAIEGLTSGGGRNLCGTVLARSVRWHEPGRNLVAGDYEGCDEVGSLFGRLRDLSEGTYGVIEWETVATAGHRVIALYAVRARRQGRDLLSRDVCVADVSDGAVVSAQVFHADQRAWDRFWS